MNGKRLFLIEKDGATVSWCPNDVQIQKNYGGKLWKSLAKQLKNGFGKITINENTLKYHPSTNVIKLNNNTGDKLNKKNIENYSTLLKSSKSSIRMYFYIGDTAPRGDVYVEEGDDGNENSKRAIIISSKLMNAPKNVLGELQKRGGKVVNAQMTMKLGECKDGENLDGDKFYEKIMVFLNKLYQTNDDTIDLDSYDEFPYKIYQIEPSVWNNSNNEISKQALKGDLSGFDQFLTKYDLDIELDGADVLQDFFKGNEECHDFTLFVTYKKYLVLILKSDHKTTKTVCHWAPSFVTIKNVENGDDDDVDWDKEFTQLKKDVSKYFDLVNSDDITFEQCDDQADIDCGDDIQEIWEELTDDDSLTIIKIWVSGELAPKDAPVEAPLQSAAQRAQGVTFEASPGSVKTDKHMFYGEDDFKKDAELILDTDQDLDESVLVMNQEEEVGDDAGDDNKEMMIDSNIDDKILVQINRIDKVLIDVNDTNLSEDVEKELEFICDNLRKRQNGVSALKVENNQQECSGGDELFGALKQRLDGLTNLMKNSDDYNDKNKIVQAIKRAHDACVYDHDLFLTSSELVKAMREVRAFDIEETITLFNKTMEASRSVKGKDICLLLGKTGAGKSTTIHFLAGSEMVKDARTGHVEPRKGSVKNHHLKNVKTEWTVTESVTRYIAGVPIKLSDFGVKVGFGSLSKNLITLCDAPGFDDSGGPEIDVANGLGIVYGVSQARSAKILLVLTKANLDERMKGIKDVSHTLAKIFPNFAEYMSSVSVVFTKMDLTKTQLRSQIKKASTEMDGKDNDDVAFLTLLDHIGELDDNKLIFLNPVPKPPSKAPAIRKKILETLFDKRASWIRRPSEEFKKFVTQSSLSAIDQQLLLHEAAIRKAVNDCNRGGEKKTNYQLIETKIGQLRKLQQLLDSENIGECLNSCNKIVLKKWNQRCEDARKEIETSTKSRSLEEFKIDVNNYKEMLVESKECEMLQKELIKQQTNLEEKNNDATTNAQLVITGTDSLELTLNTQMKYLVDQCTLDFKSEVYFRKAEIMIDVFGEKYKTAYNKKLHELLNVINDLEHQTAGMINDDKDFKDIYRNFCQLESMKHLSGTFDTNTLSVSHIIQKLEQHLIKHLTKGCDFIKEIFDIDTSMGCITSIDIILQDTIKKCGKYMKSLKNSQKTFGSSMCQPGGSNNTVGDKIEKLHNDAVKVIVEFCKQHRRIIEELLRIDGYQFDIASVHSDESHNRQQTKQYVTQLSRICKFDSEIEVKTSGIYYHTIDYVFRYFDNERIYLCGIVDAIENNDSNVKYADLVRCVLKLRECSWIFQFRNDNGDNNDNNDDNSNEILQKIEVQ